MKNIMKKLGLWSIALIILAVRFGDSARILALFPIPGKSHFISFQNYLEELAKQGHQLTVISAFPRKTPLANYTDLAYEDYFTNVNENEKFNVFERQELHPTLFMLIMRQNTPEMCEKFLMFPEIQKFIHSHDQHFDLIIYEPFLMECTYGILNKFRVPTIQISSNAIAKWMGDGVGNPFMYSYVPEMILGYSHQMSFLQRFINTLTYVVFEFQRNFIIFPKMHAIATKALGNPNIPDLREIETNASLLLINSHVSLNYPRPFTPNTIEVGGMHLKPPKKLPQDLQKLLDDSTNGVIYFSMGTNVRGSEIPGKLLEAFVNAFSRIKETVLWKFDLDSIPNLSKNVHLQKWFPQNDILGHSNIRAFITHGGLLSTQEATYLGIPLIALPLMADQKYNARKAEDQGLAIYLDIKNVTEHSLIWAINEITTNIKYKEKAKQLSQIFQDQPQNPIDRAIFWTEYVLRHNGARHMRSASLDLNYIEYLLLDVIAAIFIAICCCTVVGIIIFRILYKTLFLKKSLTSQQKKSKHLKKVN